jgi:hypothetical protein
VVNEFQRKKVRNVNWPWRQSRLDWDRNNVPPAEVVRILAMRILSGLVGISLLAAVVCWLGRHEPGVRGPAGGVGMTAAMLSLPTALWCALRIRRWPLVGMVAMSCVPVAIWTWLFLYFAVHA